MAGGCVELLPEDVGAQNLLAAPLREGNRSLVKITPAHLELLNTQITREQAAGITRAFVIGGENCAFLPAIGILTVLLPNLTGSKPVSM
jgi:hypothetical protein